MPLTYFYSAGIVFLSRRMIPSFVGDRSTTKNIFSLIAEGVSFVRRNKLMRSIYIGILGAFGAGGLVAGVAQAYVATLGAGNAGYGILFGSVFTGLALGMLIGPKVFPTVPRRMIFTPAIGAAGISLIVMSVLQDFLGAVITASVMGVFAGIAWINGFTMIGHEVSDQLRGRVFAFVMSSVRIVLLATIAAGPILAGAIGSYPVTVGDFRFDVTGPAIVLAAGGLIAFAVSLITGRQIGGLTSGLTRRIFGRRGVNIWDEQDDHAGVLIAVEGADRAAVAEYSGRISEHLRGQGWVTARVHAPGPAPDARVGSRTARQMPCGRPPTWPTSSSSGSAHRCRPARWWCARDSSTPRSCAYRAAGVQEQRLARVAQWAVNGLKADLTVLVDGPRATPGRAPRRPASDRAGCGARGGAERLRASADPAGARQTVQLAEVHRAILSAARAAGRRRAAAREPGPDSIVRAAGAGGPHRQRRRRAPMPSAAGRRRLGVRRTAGTVRPVGRRSARTGRGRHDDDDDEPVDPVQAYRDRASYTPERYLIVRPLAEEPDRAINPEVAERIGSVLRQRSPSLAEPQPAGRTD